MKAGIENKVSNYAFYALMVVTAVVLGLFYLVGYDNMSQVAAGMVTDPENLDLLMYWMYALLAICALSIAIFSSVQFVASLKSNPKGAIKGLVVVALLVALFGGAYALADDAPVLNNGTVFDDKNILVLTDVCIFVQYVLLAVSVVCTIVSLLGLFKAVNKVKA